MARVTSGVDKFGQPLDIIIDGYLQKALDKAKSRVLNKNWDYVSLVCGLPGCLDYSTSIKTSKGDIAIGELYEQGEKSIQVLSLDLENDKEIICGATIIDSGEKELYELETEDGRIVQASMDHVFFVEKDGKIYELPLKEIEVGDHIVCRKEQIIKNFEEVKKCILQKLNL